jgi:hypothetical protein
MKAGNRIMIVATMLAAAFTATAQTKVDPERMERDIEVAENVLATLIKQQLAVRNNFFPVEVEGTYMEGYGVTFRLPTETFWLLPQLREEMFQIQGQVDGFAVDQPDEEDGPVRVRTLSSARNSNRNSRPDTTSAINYYNKVIQASKDFLADYGDMLSQLRPTERITITNRHENQRFWFPGMNDGKRNYVSVEAMKSDLTQFRTGKLTREQLMAKINVINSESTDELDPDLELLSSIFNRLYRQDLSRTFFTQEEVYYERLKDFGAIFQMQVYSSNLVQEDWNREGRSRLYDMPTLNLKAIDQKTRDEKVRDIYPKFENELKENLLEYGRTVKSLKPEEALVFNVKVTRCEACGIPASLELSVKGAVLADYAAARITKEAALAKVSVKKGVNQ